MLQYACGDYDEDNVNCGVVYQPVEYKGDRMTYESFSSLRMLDSYHVLKPDIRACRIQLKRWRQVRIRAEHASDVKAVDMLTIDVEGCELFLMDAFSPRRNRPKVVIMETLMDDRKYRSHMREHSYRLHRAMNPNDVFVPV